MYYEDTDHYKNVQLTVSMFEGLRMPIIGQINKFVDEISIQTDGALLSLCVRCVCVRNIEGRPNLLVY